jgi:hypothetical protein
MTKLMFHNPKDFLFSFFTRMLFKESVKKDDALIVSKAKVVSVAVA